VNKLRDWLPALFGILLGLLVMRCAHAADATAAPPAEKKPLEFDSMNEAAAYALQAAYKDHPHYYEFGGVIVQGADGKFMVSAPAGLYHADNTEIDEDPESYELLGRIVGDYHTHPCMEGYVPDVFSPADLHSMRSYGRPGYILDECTGDVHLWEPGVDGYTTDGLNPIEVIMGVKIAKGRIVGHVPVDGKKIEL
jgi:hypothetical protein